MRGDFLAGQTGSGVRIAVVDSGINALHPHIQGVSSGVGIDGGGCQDPDYVDSLGHGTAVAATIREKAPAAELCAVKVFYDALSTRIDALVRAIEWSMGQAVQLVNLSLGTRNPAHETILREVLEKAAASGITTVAAAEQDGIRWLPGSIPGVLPVLLDWGCRREEFRCTLAASGRALFRASGYPRDAPGIPRERNLSGVSFAVANMTGFAARALQTHPSASFPDLVEVLKEACSST